jgi:hypothetical protein
MWMLKKNLEEMTNIHSLNIKFNSTARDPKIVKEVLDAAQCLRDIPVRDKAGVIWSRDSYDNRVIKHDELQEVETAMQDSWVKLGD